MCEMKYEINLKYYARGLTVVKSPGPMNHLGDNEGKL